MEIVGMKGREQRVTMALCIRSSSLHIPMLVTVNEAVRLSQRSVPFISLPTSPTFPYSRPQLIIVTVTCKLPRQTTVNRAEQRGMEDSIYTTFVCSFSQLVAGRHTRRIHRSALLHASFYGPLSLSPFRLAESFCAHIRSQASPSPLPSSIYDIFTTRLTC